MVAMVERPYVTTIGQSGVTSPSDGSIKYMDFTSKE